KFTIPEDVAFYLAGRNDDIKVLLEDLVRLQANISIYHTDLDISTVKSLLEGNRPGSCPSIADILRITAAYFNLSLADILSDKKTRTLSYPRHLAMYLCRKHTGRPLKEIGRAFGRKDHSTVIYAVKRITPSNGLNPRFVTEKRFSATCRNWNISSCLDQLFDRLIIYRKRIWNTLKEIETDQKWKTRVLQHLKTFRVTAGGFASIQQFHVDYG
ncbi:MAG: hypothetical protein JRJ83_16795, partial [Deltaproteobacteria bacterium]|nr:hypothetical protein [Deltaproteobacteria bacterium]